jgi:hypothetical protein
MPAMVDAYLLWKQASDVPNPQVACNPPEVDGVIHLQVIDVFGEIYINLCFVLHSST